MTRKLYYEDAYIRSFEAKVEACQLIDNQWHILLDKTAFYPEGGGQPSDQGFIAEAGIEHVYEENGLIWHISETFIDIGREAICSINWGRRFHFMQQHLGQHILSAVLMRELEAKTVGVHFGVQTSTIDIDIPITHEQAADIELMANDAIYLNTPVETLTPSIEEIKANSRRDIPDTNEPIRIIKIADLDYTPCCGTHNCSTGEVGLIKLYRQESYKGGTRIGFACGGAAFVRHRQLYDELCRAQRLLSVTDTEVADRVEKLLSDMSELRGERNALMERVLEVEADKMVEAAIPIGGFKLVYEAMYATNREDMRGLFARLVQRPGVVAVLGGEVPGGAMLIFGRYRGESRIDVRDVFKQSLEFISGKGGGSPAYCQGMGTDASRLREVVEAAGRVMEDTLAAIAQEEIMLASDNSGG